MAQTAEQQTAWRNANRDKYRANARAWYAKNKERVSARKKARYQKHITEARVYHRSKRLEYKYGITLADKEARLHSQNDACAICQKALGHDLRDIHLDHCHDTGKVRGVLCNSCNAGLGRFKNSAAFLRAAANYLEGNQL